MIVLAIIIAAAAGVSTGWYATEIAQRTTGLTIPFDRPFHATVGGVAGALTGFGIGMSWTLIAWLIVANVGLILSFIDVAHHRLPDLLVIPLYPATLAALILPTWASQSTSSYVSALIWMVVLFGVYFLLALIYPKGMGFGDVKFAGVLGLALGYLGAAYVFVGFLLAFVLSSIVSLGLIAAKRADRKTQIPFGPFMVAGAILTLVVGQILS